MLQFSREKLFLLHAEICATFWYQLRHFPWPGPTSCSSLHPLIRNETPSSDLIHYSRFSYHGALIKALYFPTSWPLSAHCMEMEDFKILILFLAMMNLIGDIWVYQLVNDQLTKKTNTMDDDFIYQRKLGTGRWGWSNHDDSKRQNIFFWTDCFSTEQKDWVHATIRIFDTKTICHVSLIRW